MAGYMATGHPFLVKMGFCICAMGPAPLLAFPLVPNGMCLLWRSPGHTIRLFSRLCAAGLGVDGIWASALDPRFKWWTYRLRGYRIAWPVGVLD